MSVGEPWYSWGFPGCPGGSLGVLGGKPWVSWGSSGIRGGGGWVSVGSLGICGGGWVSWVRSPGIRGGGGWVSVWSPGTRGGALGVHGGALVFVGAPGCPWGALGVQREQGMVQALSAVEPTGEERGQAEHKCDTEAALTLPPSRLLRSGRAPGQQAPENQPSASAPHAGRGEPLASPVHAQSPLVPDPCPALPAAPSPPPSSPH